MIKGEKKNVRIKKSDVKEVLEKLQTEGFMGSGEFLSLSEFMTIYLPLLLKLKISRREIFDFFKEQGVNLGAYSSFRVAWRKEVNRRKQEEIKKEGNKNEQ